MAFPPNPCTQNILVSILELPIISSEAIQFCGTYLYDRAQRRDATQAPIIATSQDTPAAPVPTKYVITDLLARDLEQRTTKPPSPSTTSSHSVMKPLPACLMGYAESRVSTACSCLLTAESCYPGREGGIVCAPARKHRRHVGYEATVVDVVVPKPTNALTRGSSIRGGRGGVRTGRGGKGGSSAGNEGKVQAELV